jgi:hypothetical protein
MVNLIVLLRSFINFPFRSSGRTGVAVDRTIGDNPEDDAAEQGKKILLSNRSRPLDSITSGS